MRPRGVTRSAERPPMAAISAAAKRIAEVVFETPLVRLATPGRASIIYLKLECLQPTGSYKIRGAYNAISSIPMRELAGGIVTASSGNFGHAAAWTAQRLGIACRVVVPESASPTKLAEAERLGADLIRVSYDDWWRILETGEAPCDGRFVHPTFEPGIAAGDGTITLEIARQLTQDADLLLVPWGAGGLCIGVAAAARALMPQCRVGSVEPEGAAPLATSRAQGQPTAIEAQALWIDGAGGNSLLPGVWELIETLVDENYVVTSAQTAAAVRLLAARAKIVAEGAGALSVAAALSLGDAPKRIVCIVSGGNIDLGLFARILTDPNFN